MSLVDVSRELCRAVAPLSFAAPVRYVYNPLEYAREPHEQYVRRFARKGLDALLLGMNPGPFGMVQTGVPFGEVQIVREWLGIEGKVGRPRPECPGREVLGFGCPRSEVSGRRLWGWVRERFGTPQAFFERFFVWNYCPLAFLEEGGRNRTPDKLPAREREALFAACDRALERSVRALAPKLVVGIGSFAAERARRVLAQTGPPVGSALHPSPASPKANRGWAREFERELRALGIELS